MSRCYFGIVFGALSRILRSRPSHARAVSELNNSIMRFKDLILCKRGGCLLDCDLLLSEISEGELFCAIFRDYQECPVFEKPGDDA